MTFISIMKIPDSALSSSLIGVSINRFALQFFFGGSLLILAAAVSASGDPTEREGIVISIDSVGGQLVAVDPVPVSVNYRRVSSSLEAAIIDPRKREAPSDRSLKKLLEDVPIGTVFLNVKTKDGGPRAIIPLRPIKAYASHHPNNQIPGIELVNGPVQYWGNPRISLEGATISVMQRSKAGSRLLGDVEVKEK
jgi:hypothetical protein